MGYKILLLVVVLVMLGLNTSAQAWTELKAIPTQGVVSVDTLNLRDEPSTEADIIEVLHLGDKVDILEWEEYPRSERGTLDRYFSYHWAEVRLGDRVGFIAAERYLCVNYRCKEVEYYLTLVKFDFVDEHFHFCIPGILDAIVNVDTLNLRSEPSVTGKILDTLTLGDRPEILEWPVDYKYEVNTDYLWAKVQFGGQIGFVAVEKYTYEDDSLTRKNTEYYFAIIQYDGCG